MERVAQERGCQRLVPWDGRGAIVVDERRAVGDAPLKDALLLSRCDGRAEGPDADRSAHVGVSAGEGARGGEGDREDGR